MIYDKIYVGSGPILMLDAINNFLKNEKILIIDKSQKLGGAWKPINLFGDNKVENAVHYLLPNEKGYSFLRNTFKVKLEKCRRKYFAINFLNYKTILPISNLFGKVIYSINGGDQAENSVWENIKKLLLNKKIVNKTQYPNKGFIPIVEKIIDTLENLGIEYKLNEEIKEINIKNNNIVNLKTNNYKFKSKKLIISHGFIPPKFFLMKGSLIQITLKKHPRPSIHIISKANNKKYLNSKFFKYSQVLFPKNHLIKYVHQLSQYQIGLKKNKNQLIIVAALNHNVKKTKKVISLISKNLEEYGLIPKFFKNNNNDYFWQDILIPQIDTEDLIKVSSKTNNIVSFLKTECLNTALGEYSESWNFPENLFSIK